MPPLPPSSNPRPPRPLRLIAGAGIALGIGLLVVAVLLAIWQAAGDAGGTAASVDVWHLLRMTAIQAGLSTALSLLVGTALAWALNRLRFFGRDLLVGLFASAIVTPGLVVAFGLLAVWGRAGWVNTVAHWFGLSAELPIFGLGGILAAHVILDASFAARILLARLDALPDRRLKSGQSLGLTAWQRFTIIDWPMLRPSLPGLAVVIFLLAFTSFPIVLLLGGGPANQTLEVAIYSAVRLDFDLPAAVKLALVQIGVCAVLILAGAAFAPVSSSTGRSPPPSWRDGTGARLLQSVIVSIAALGFGLPLLSILVNGVSPDLPAFFARPTTWSALGSSLGIGATSALLSLLLALAVATARAATARQALRIGIGAPAYAYLAVPAVVLSLGFFLIVRNLGISPESAAPIVVILANALLSLPFALATLAPPLDAIALSRGRLIRSLGLKGWRQFTAIEWPLVGREAGVVLALGFCFSLGDLGVIALFGTQDFTTLPLLMYRALGAYRSHDAAIIAALMLVITVLAFRFLPPLVGKLTDARR